MKRILLPVTAAALLALTACGGANPTVTPAAPDPTSASSTPATPEPSETQMPHTYAFGSTATWPDGTAITIGKPEPFKPSESAYAGDGKGPWVKFTVTLVNGTAEPVESMDAAYIRATSGDQEVMSVSDSEQDVTWPVSRVLPGKTLRWVMAFEKPNDDLLVTVSHGLDNPVTFHSSGGIQ